MNNNKPTQIYELLNSLFINGIVLHKETYSFPVINSLESYKNDKYASQDILPNVNTPKADE